MIDPISFTCPCFYLSVYLVRVLRVSSLSFLVCAFPACSQLYFCISPQCFRFAVSLLLLDCLPQCPTGTELATLAKETSNQSEIHNFMLGHKIQAISNELTRMFRFVLSV